MLFGEARHINARQIAGNDERRARRVERLGVARHNSVAIEGSDCLAQARQRSDVRRIGRVDRLWKHALGAAARIGQGLHQVVQPLVAQPLDLLGWERRLGHHLGQQRQRGAEMRFGHLDAGAERLPRRVGVDLRAKPLGGFDELVRVALARAFRHCPGRQHAHAGLVGRLGPAATGQQQLCREQRPSGQVGMDDGQAVAQGRALEAGEVVLARPAGAGSDVEHGEVLFVDEDDGALARRRDDARRLRHVIDE